jgi:hypothetical protein
MSPFTPLMQLSKLVHKGMGVSRFQNVNNHQYFIIRRFYNAKVQSAKIRDIISFWPYEHYSLLQWLALLHFGTLHFSILVFAPLQFCTMQFCTMHDALLHYVFLHYVFLRYALSHYALLHYAL